MKRSRSRTQTAPSGSTHGRGLPIIIVGMAMFATMIYGAVDVWALIPLSLVTTLIVGLWAIKTFKEGKFAFNTAAIQLPILFLLAIAAIQILPLPGTAVIDAGLSPAATLSLDPYATRLFAVRLALLIVFFAAALVFLAEPATARRVAVAIVIFGGSMAFAGILQRLTSPDAIYGMRPTPQAIPFGPFVNQHHFAAFMEMTFGLTMGMLLGPLKNDRKALLAIALVLMAVAVVMTGSRGGMLSIIAVAGTAAVLSIRAADRGSKPSQLPLMISGGLLAVIVVGSAVLFLSGADPLVRGLGLGTDSADPTSGRLHFWSVALKIFSDHPIIGVGFDAFGVAFTRYDTWNGFFRIEQAHNDYLQILADGGILAFACVAAFAGLLCKESLKSIKLELDGPRRSISIGAFAGCVGILVHSFFDFPLRTPSNAYFFLLLVVLAIAGGRAARREIS